MSKSRYSKQKSAGLACGMARMGKRLKSKQAGAAAFVPENRMGRRAGWIDSTRQYQICHMS